MPNPRLSRRKFLALTGAAAAHTAAAHAAPATPPRPANTQSLAGTWRFALDRDDTGKTSSWFNSALPEDHTITLPGFLQSQGYGNEISVDTPWVAALPRDMRWYLLPQYKPYTKPGHIEMPYLSQPIRHYLGVAWYQREIDVPAAWRGKHIALTLERARWRTTIYVDSNEIGSCTSLVAPHEYALGILPPGKHRISIRIDNRMIFPYRPDGHSVSDAEGYTWNGIVGKIALTATSPVWIDDAQVHPNVALKSALVKVTIGNVTGAAGSGTLSSGSISTHVTWTADGGTASLEVPIPGAKPWSEFTPVLQHLTLKLTGHNADDEKPVTFGLREIKTDGKQILLNGELFSFRATHNGGGYPIQGTPPTDVASWRRIIAICKAWGLNGMRFHSWCPPEAAFTAADELGFYFQPECGMWNSFDTEHKMLDILNDETARLIRTYGNHPSLVLLNASNEPAGHYREQLPVWDKKWRDADPRRLYSDGTGRFAPPPGGPGTPFAANYLVTPSPARGPRGWFGADYEAILRRMTEGEAIPAIGHEVGQWCAYPDFSVIEKFKGGYLVPDNYRIWRDSAVEHHLLAKNKQIAHASGRFQLACYKEEVEANFRTPSYSGIELLDLHDYLGQGGALIGLLDAFWQSKGYATPAEFRAFCNTTVPLARLKDRVFTTADTLSTEVELSHFGAAPLPPTTPHWRIVNSAGKSVASGRLSARAMPRGKNIPLGTITADLSKLHAPAQYKLVVSLRAGDAMFENDWPFWLYPEHSATPANPSSEILITNSWPEAEGRLARGGKVLFTPDPSTLGPDNPRLSTVPIFWNRLMNPRGAWMLGLLVDHIHPALAGFPSEANCDWQWVDLLPNAHAINLDALPPALDPIVQPIDDWNRNYKFGMLYECRAGKGKLMVCAFDLTSTRPGAPSLRRSILDYMTSAKFRPSVAIPIADLHSQWLNPHPAPDTPANPHQPSSSPDLVDPGQIRRLPQPH